MLFMKAVLLLAAGALAQQARFTVSQNCTLFTGSGNFSFCATAAAVPGTSAAISVGWSLSVDDNTTVDIAVFTPASGNATWCAVGLSDGDISTIAGRTAMLSSSVVVLGAGIDAANASDYDLQIGAAPRAGPTSSPDAQRQGVTSPLTLANNDGFAIRFTRTIAPAGLDPTRHFTGEKTLIMSCGNHEEFNATTQHNVAVASFRVNLDTGAPGVAPAPAPAPAPAGGNSASSLKGMSVAFIAAVISSLF